MLDRTMDLISLWSEWPPAVPPWTLFLCHRSTFATGSWGNSKGYNQKSTWGTVKRSSNFKGGSGVTSRFVIYSFLIGSNYSLPRLSSNLLPFCHNVGAVSIIPRTRYVAHHTKIPKAMIPSWYQRSFSFRKPGIDSNLWNSPLDHVEPDITGLRNPVELKMSQLCQTRIDVRYFLAHRLEVRIV